MKWTYIKILFCYFIYSGSFLSGQQTHNTLLKEVKLSLTLSYKYLLHIPDNDELKQDGLLPLIVFLHGAGERGSELNLVKTHGPPKIAEKEPRFPFAILSPQCSIDERWDPVTLDLLLDEVLSDYPIDPARIYLTGLSMGGRGTWDWAMYSPERFAAIAPICGWGERFMASKLKNMPIWVFHGALDRVVRIQESSDMVNALKNSGNQKVIFTVYPEAGHDSWTEAYNDPKLYEWFLLHRKG